jgi:HlyD family secretion protein
MRPTPLPEAIVTGNGRIEATEIDIATKTPGRIVEILPYEGDFVQFGMVLARMDIDCSIKAFLRPMIKRGNSLMLEQLNILTRPFNTVHHEPVEGCTSLGFDKFSPNGIPVINRAGLKKSPL